MHIHYNNVTKRMTGYTTFALETAVFNEPTIVIPDRVIEFPPAEYIVDDVTFGIRHVGLSDEDKAIQLTNAKEAKRKEISKIFDIEAYVPVTVAGITYFGGDASATKLDAAKRLTELVGLAEVTFFDVDNIGHILTIAEATQVIVALAVKYQADFAKKQGLYVDIASATTLAELSTIVW